MGSASDRAPSVVRLGVITEDDMFFEQLECMSREYGWHLERAHGLLEGLAMVRNPSLPVIIYDWDASSDDWRDGLSRLAAESRAPCILLASRAVDENLRDEVRRLHGYDVVARSCDKSALARSIGFAWFWATRSQGQAGYQ